MKFIAKIVIFSLCIANVHAELLIIKRVQPQAAASSSSSSRASQSVIAPLDESDEHNYPAIAQVLLNYQWPMVIANTNLTPAEKDELLTADVPNAEEYFIRKKLKKINSAYDVAFFPTCLYELFILTAAKESIVSTAIGELSESNIKEKLTLNILNEINGKGPLKDPRQDVYNVYKAKNALYYQQAFFDINNQIIQFLCELIDFSYISNGIELNTEIQKKTQKINRIISSKILKNPELLEEYSKKTNIFKNKDQYKLIINQMIDTEYIIKKSNIGLLLRGSELVSLKRNKKTIFKIIGTTLTEKDILTSILQSYKNDSVLPYSVSFGNSLFAGFFLDHTACVAHYLSKNEDYYGYGLIINKKDYINNQSSSLFFISPLAPIAALFTTGEFFHPRTKICIRQNIGSIDTIRGLADDSKTLQASNFIDPDHMITTTNDPLVNAEIFSDYLRKNMYIITAPQDQKHFSTEEEILINYKKVINNMEQLRENQKKTTDYYKAIRKLNQHLPIATRNYRQKLDDEKALKEAIQNIEVDHEKTSMETELS